MDEEIIFGENGLAADESESPADQKPERKVVGACPLCGSDVYEYAKGWGCSKGKGNCDFFLGRVILGHEVTDEEISDLLIKGETKIIHDFVSKRENEGNFSARLKYGKNLIFDYGEEKKAQ